MEKSFTSKQVADFVGGKLTGDENVKLNFLSPPALATENMLAIAFEKEHLEQMYNTKALCVLLPEGVPCEGKTCIHVERPKLAMGILLNMFFIPPEAPKGVHSTAVIAPTVQMGKNVSVGPHAVIGNKTIIGDNVRILSNVNIGSSAQIGNECLLYPGVYIGDRVVIGNEVIIHSNTCIGSDGYSYVTEKASNLEKARLGGEIGENSEQVIIKVPSIGTVIIEDQVEIGSNASVDRGTIQNTIIRRNTKIDNLVQIAHNADIGESCFIVSQSGVSGSSKVGNRCTVGGQVGIVDHVSIGDDTIIMGRAGVSKSLRGKEVYGGTPAVTRKEFIRQLQSVKSIPAMKEKIKKLEEMVKEKETV